MDNRPLSHDPVLCRKPNVLPQIDYVICNHNHKRTPWHRNKSRLLHDLIFPTQFLEYLFIDLCYLGELGCKLQEPSC